MPNNILSTSTGYWVDNNYHSNFATRYNLYSSGSGYNDSQLEKYRKLEEKADLQAELIRYLVGEATNQWGVDWRDERIQRISYIIRRIDELG